MTPRTLPTLIERDGPFCYWCRCYVIDLTSWRKLSRAIIQQTETQVFFLDRGESICVSIASKDHVIPKWVGGNDVNENLVVACVACNRDRGHIHAPFSFDPTGFAMWLLRKRYYKRATSTPTRLTFRMGETPAGRDLRSTVKRIDAA